MVGENIREPSSQYLITDTLDGMGFIDFREIEKVVLFADANIMNIYKRMRIITKTTARTLLSWSWVFFLFSLLDESIAALYVASPVAQSYDEASLSPPYFSVCLDLWGP